MRDDLTMEVEPTVRVSLQKWSNGSGCNLCRIGVTVNGGDTTWTEPMCTADMRFLTYAREALDMALGDLGRGLLLKAIAPEMWTAMGPGAKEAYDA